MCEISALCPKKDISLLTFVISVLQIWGANLFLGTDICGRRISSVAFTIQSGVLVRNPDGVGGWLLPVVEWEAAYGSTWEAGAGAGGLGTSSKHPRAPQHAAGISFVCNWRSSELLFQCSDCLQSIFQW